MSSETRFFVICVICLLSSNALEPYEFLKTAQLCQNVSMCNGTKHRFSDLKPSEIANLDCSCYACNCLQNCSLYGNCCPDRIIADVVHQYTCIPFYIESIIEIVSGENGVLLMNTCPNNTLHPEEAKKCHSSTDPKAILNPPVTSLSLNVNYRNKHCARCNDVTDYITWSLKLHCTDENYYNIGNGTLMPGCRALYISPTESYHPCHYKPIDSCNVTGEWKTADPMLQEGCASAPRQDYRVSVKTIYKNAYCLECNNGFAHIGRLLPCFYRVPRAPFTRSILLDFNTGGDKEDNTCPLGYGFDPFKNACRHVSCPLSRVFASCGCISQDNSNIEIVIYTIGFTLDVDMYLDLYQSSSVQTISNYLFREFQLRHEEYNMFPKARSYTLWFVIDQTHACNSTEGKLIKIYASINLFSFPNDFNNVTDMGILSLYVKPVFVQELNTTLYPHYDTESLKLGKPDGYRRNCANVPQLPSNQCVTLREKVVSTLPRSFLKIIAIPKYITPITYNCSRITLQRDEYETDNKYISIRIIATGKNVSSSRFDLHADNTVTVCLFDYINCSHVSLILVDNKRTEEILSYVTVCSSLLCLALTLYTYVRFETLLNLPGKINALCAGSLFGAQLLFIAGVQRTEYEVVCKIMGIIIHYFYLMHIFSTNVCSIHMYRVFSKVMKATGSNKVFLAYLLYTLLGPLFIVGATVTGSYIMSSEIGYGGDVCFIARPFTIVLSFVVPCILMVIVNVLLYIMNVVNLSRSSKLSKTVNQNRRFTSVYIKLSCLTGATWLLGLFAELFNNDILAYLFTILNGSQGVFLFIVFVCNKRVINLYRDAYLKGD